MDFREHRQVAFFMSFVVDVLNQIQGYEMMCSIVILIQYIVLCGVSLLVKRLKCCCYRFINYIHVSLITCFIEERYGSGIESIRKSKNTMSFTWWFIRMKGRAGLVAMRENLSFYLCQKTVWWWSLIEHIYNWLRVYVFFPIFILTWNIIFKSSPNSLNLSFCISSQWIGLLNSLLMCVHCLFF